MNFKPLSEREESIAKKLTTEHTEDAKKMLRPGLLGVFIILVAE